MSGHVSEQRDKEKKEKNKEKEKLIYIYSYIYMSTNIYTNKGHIADRENGKS